MRSRGWSCKEKAMAHVFWKDGGLLFLYIALMKISDMDKRAGLNQLRFLVLIEITR